MTIKDVAKRAGVSIATVSRHLNNPSSIKNENRLKVAKAIKELNYRPYIFARRLAGGKLNTFGLIIPGYEGIFYSFYALEIIRGVAQALNKQGIDLHLHIFWDRDNFKNSLVDGVVFADIIGNEEQLDRLVREETPLIVINRKSDKEQVSFVAIDNFRGAYDAVEFLVRHGHKHIAHLAGDLRVQCAQERLAGYKAALEKNKVPVKKEYIRVTAFSRREAREQAEKLFSLPQPPTAIFCCSDEVASEVLSFCEERRIAVPKQLSVIGFDDNPHCIYGKLTLTTVRQPIKMMAGRAVEILEGMVAGKITKVKRIVLEPELVVRDTVAFI